MLKQIRNEIKILQKENKFFYKVLNITDPTYEKVEEKVNEICRETDLSELVGYSKKTLDNSFRNGTSAFLMYTTPKICPELFHKYPTIHVIMCAILITLKKNNSVEFRVLESKMGCGGKIIDYFEEHFCQDVNEILLVSSLRAINFYQKKGFEMDITLTNEQFRPILIKRLQKSDTFSSHKITKVPVFWNYISKFNYILDS